MIFQDEMTESVEAETFQQRLWDMFPHVFPCTLSLPQIDRVRYHLFPEVRVSAAPGQFGLFAEAGNDLQSLVRVMDLQQELLARSMGDGHRVIHGAAGTGKTMILGCRAAPRRLRAPRSSRYWCFASTRPWPAGCGRWWMRAGSVTGEVRSFPARGHEKSGAHQVSPPAASVPVGELMVHTVALTVVGGDRGQITHGQYAAG